MTIVAFFAKSKSNFWTTGGNKFPAVKQYLCGSSNVGSWRIYLPITVTEFIVLQAELIPMTGLIQRRQPLNIYYMQNIYKDNFYCKKAIYSKMGSEVSKCI